MGFTSKWLFVLGLPSGSPEIAKVGTPATLRRHNFACKTSMKMKSEAKLTIGLSFGHNLCFRCSNGWCELILDIYVPRAFQWYNERLKTLRFDPYNRPLNIQESTGTPTPKVEPLGGVRVHSLTPSHTPGSMLCDSRLPSWPTTLQTLALVTSPRLGLQQKLKHWKHGCFFVQTSTISWKFYVFSYKYKSTSVVPVN
jgi:hypothetical protein